MRTSNLLERGIHASNRFGQVPCKPDVDSDTFQLFLAKILRPLATRLNHRAKLFHAEHRHASDCALANLLPLFAGHQVIRAVRNAARCRPPKLSIKRSIRRACSESRTGNYHVLPANKPSPSTIRHPHCH